MKNIKTILLAGLVTVAFGCREESKQTLPDRSWTMVWSDEFNEAAGTSPDVSKWTFDIGNGTNGWGNNELQYYTNRPENVAMDGNGNLVITAKSEGYNGYAYTSARIKTEGLYEQEYGKVEARLKTPYGPGIWPAFWMLGNDVNNVGWPQCGEIDIMEMKGNQPSIVHGSLHGPGYSGGSPITDAYGLENGRFDTDFHTFSVEWTPDKIDFFVDDYLYQRVEKTDVTGEWVYDHPFFIILNVAVGGDYVGFPTTETPLPQEMIIDYVRVYDAK